MDSDQAVELGRQAGLDVVSADDLWAACEARGWTVGVDKTTGDWVILNGDLVGAEVLARCP